MAQFPPLFENSFNMECNQNTSPQQMPQQNYLQPKSLGAFNQCNTLIHTTILTFCKNKFFCLKKVLSS